MEHFPEPQSLLKAARQRPVDVKWSGGWIAGAFHCPTWC